MSVPTRDARTARQCEDEPRVVYLMGDPLFVAPNAKLAARFVQLLNAGAMAEEMASPRDGPVMLEVERDQLERLYREAIDLHGPLILMHAAASGPLFEQLGALRDAASRHKQKLERILWS